MDWLQPVLDKIKDTMIRKNHDYSSGKDWKSNFQKYGLYGMCARMSDKVERIENLLFNDEVAAVSESVEDTLEDLAAYALLIRQAFLEDLAVYGNLRPPK